MRLAVAIPGTTTHQETHHEQSCDTNRTAAETVKAFNSLLAEKGLTFHIVDQLVGEERHGLISVRLAGLGNAFAKALDKEMYRRSSVSWSSADAQLGRPRTGGPKHLALLALVARLRAS